MTPETRAQITELVEIVRSTSRDEVAAGKAVDRLMTYLLDNLPQPDLDNIQAHTEIRRHWLDTRNRNQFRNIWDDETIPDALVTEMTMREIMAVDKIMFNPLVMLSWNRFADLYQHAMLYGFFGK